MRKLSFQKVTLFVVNRVLGIFCLALFFVAILASVGVKQAEACSTYDGYGCGSYALSNYGDYDNYWPYYSTSVGCGGCGYMYPSYNYYGNNYGYSMSNYGGYNYVQYPTYQYVTNPQTNRGNGTGLSNYNYVQYPYYNYTYFQNPAPSQSRNSLDTYNYVQYPYSTYVYNR